MARKTGSSGKKTAHDLRIAATSLFARHGYAAVSMRQIGAEVGVRASALYLYTPDKQSLLFDLMHSHMQELLACWQDFAQDLPDCPKEQLDSFVRFHIRFHVARIDEVFIAYMELRNLTPENFNVIVKQRQQYENIVKGILVKGVNSGVFLVAEPKLATYAIIAMLTGIHTWFQDVGRLSFDEVESVYLDMVRSIAMTLPRSA